MAAHRSIFLFHSSTIHISLFVSHRFTRWPNDALHTVSMHARTHTRTHMGDAGVRVMHTDSIASTLCEGAPLHTHMDCTATPYTQAASHYFIQ